MSISVPLSAVEGAEKILTSEEMLRMGLEASTPGGETPLNLIDAHKWFNLAALQGNQEARRYRSELTVEMTSEEIAEAQKKAREFLTARRPAYLRQA